jgi:polygalacturonase
MYLPEIFSAKILVSNSVAIIDKLSQLPSVALPNNVSKIISFENNRVNTFERIDQANTNLYSDQKNSFDGSLWARSADLAEFNVPAAIADGVTDCTAAIQQAINAAKTTKKY